MKKAARSRFPRKNAFLAALGLAALCLATGLPGAALAATPIVASDSYREFFDITGQPLTPSTQMVLDTQSRFIDLFENRLLKSGDTAEIADVQAKQSVIYGLVEDPVLANALLIDVFIDSPAVEVESRIASIHYAMRWKYVLEIEIPAFTLEPGTFSKGIAPNIASELEDEGIEVLYFTNAGGEDYITECELAGVPIPPDMFAAPWEKAGPVDAAGVFDGEEFISTDLIPELWVYRSDAPPGICLSLPRYIPGTNDIELFGIICLGTQSSNACFWDNPNGEFFQRNVQISIDNFLGGADLDQNGQGECSDCHAGENPFIIHPEVAPFTGLTNEAKPATWHRPLVHPSWPQNPGPTNLLASVESERSCAGCHSAGGRIRFPEVSRELGGYCDKVLNAWQRQAQPGDPPFNRTAETDGNRPPLGGIYGTMPQNDQDPEETADLYLSHIAALEDACKEPQATGLVVDIGSITDDTSFISRPIVREPLYGCASRIAIRSTLLDATVSVYVNGALKATAVSRNPDQLIVDLPDPLVAGDIVTATQKRDGASSAPSEAAEVRDHTVDFPTGLPTPTIDPTLIHQCGSVIAVRHVPGANITTWVNGGSEFLTISGADWTAVYPGQSPFAASDKFTARISLCSDESGVSVEVAASAAPSPLPIPRFEPSDLYDGQELVHLWNVANSSRVTVSEGAAGPLSVTDTPTSSWTYIDVATALGRPLGPGDSLQAQQELCTINYSASTSDALPCGSLPAPKIRRPVVGNNYVVVIEAVPGARLRVYDATNTELGDNSGPIITLNRDIASGEKLTVVQSLNGCEGQYGYFATAVEEGTMMLTPPGTGNALASSQPPSESSFNASDTALLQVTLAGAENGSIDVCFYESDTHKLIGCDYGVDNGETASVAWSGLASSTTYRWYARGTDVLLNEVTSETVEFATAATAAVPILPTTLLLLSAGLLGTGAWRSYRRRNA